MFAWLFKRHQKTDEKKIVMVHSMDFDGRMTSRYIILDCHDAEHIKNMIVGTRLGIDAAGVILSREDLESYNYIRTLPLEYALRRSLLDEVRKETPPEQLTLAEFEHLLEKYRLRTD